MNLKNKTDKELWDMLDKLRSNDYKRYEIHGELIRREKMNLKNKTDKELWDRFIREIKVLEDKVKLLEEENEELRGVLNDIVETIYTHIDIEIR